jgi:site-specific DNA-methyltransferase (cytosine-N4-specific)
MALPYIDTQRLSLVWLGLVEPGELGALEAQLIGSRELRGTSRRDLASGMQQNSARLTGDEVAVCLELQSALGSEDGFRRRAVPVLLYRYFTGMRDAFANVRSSLKPGAKFGLIVGENRTTLGGKEYQLDTPLHLANLAGSTGWCVSESIPLQTYQRYGLHAANAIAAETLLILQR